MRSLARWIVYRLVPIEGWGRCAHEAVNNNTNNLSFMEFIHTVGVVTGRGREIVGREGVGEREREREQERERD